RSSPRTRSRRCRKPCRLCRPGAAGAGADGNRDRICHHRAPARRAARLPRPDRQRPRRWAGVAVMEWERHLLIAPVLLPLVTGAVLLLFDELRHTLKALVSLFSTIVLLIVAVALLRMAAGADGGSLSISYAVASWPAPFAIVLVLDRLSALLVLTSSILALAALVFALAKWDRGGPHFHSLFQFLLMGLGGAFLTGDLFNLFVFFEVTLAASYGLLLHGGGAFRVRSGLHYIAINLAA